MPYDPFATSPGQDATLDAALARAREVGERGVYVLDVDGCLTDTRHRQVAIFQAWAEFTGNYAVARVEPRHFENRDTVATLVNAGIPREAAERWYPELRKFWVDRFFDDAHVEFDAPMPGASRFVRALHAAGGTVVYLTGRHTSMRPAGERFFQRFGFPASRRAVWMDKPDPFTEDHVHKASRFEAISKLGDVVVAMDNEPINVNLLAERFGDDVTVFLESDQSGRKVELRPVPRIRGFLRTGEG